MLRAGSPVATRHSFVPKLPIFFSMDGPVSARAEETWDRGFRRRFSQTFTENVVRCVCREREKLRTLARGGHGR